MRYIVYDNGKAFASVTAASVVAAIEKACRQTGGHQVENCVAISVLIRDTSIDRPIGD